MFDDMSLREYKTSQDMGAGRSEGGEGKGVCGSYQASLFHDLVGSVIWLTWRPEAQHISMECLSRNSLPSLSYFKKVSRANVYKYKRNI